MPAYFNKSVQLRRDNLYPLFEKDFSITLTIQVLGLQDGGITLIPPESLPALQEIVIADKRMNRDRQLIAALADKISEAIRRNKYMIHFGV